MPTVTFPDYGYIQAGTPATVRCRGGMKNRPWADVTAHTRQKEEDVWEHALNMKHTHSYKHTNKVVFLLHSLYPCTNTQLLGDQLLHSVTEGLNRGQQTPSGLQSERQCQEFQEGGVQAGSHSTGFCGLRAAYSDDLLQQPTTPGTNKQTCLQKCFTNQLLLPFHEDTSVCMSMACVQQQH